MGHCCSSHALLPLPDLPSWTVDFSSEPLLPWLLGWMRTPPTGTSFLNLLHPSSLRHTPHTATHLPHCTPHAPHTPHAARRTPSQFAVWAPRSHFGGVHQLPYWRLLSTGNTPPPLPHPTARRDAVALPTLRTSHTHARCRDVPTPHHFYQRTRAPHSGRPRHRRTLVYAALPACYAFRRCRTACAFPATARCLQPACNARHLPNAFTRASSIALRAWRTRPLPTLRALYL